MAMDITQLVEDLFEKNLWPILIWEDQGKLCGFFIEDTRAFLDPTKYPRSEISYSQDCSLLELGNWFRLIHMNRLQILNFLKTVTPLYTDDGFSDLFNILNTVTSLEDLGKEICNFRLRLL